MSDIKHEVYLNDIYVMNTDLYKNVIRKVTWSIVFSRGDHISVAGGESDISFNPLNGFIDIDELDANKVLDWALSSHGMAKDNFIAHLRQLHTPVIERSEKESQLVIWDGMLKNQALMVDSAVIDTNDIFDVLK